MNNRKFYICLPDPNNWDDSGTVVTSLKELTDQGKREAIHVREVSPDRENAIEKMVEALEGYLDGEHIADSDGMSGEVFLSCEFDKKVIEALEAWRKANNE